MCRPAVGRRDHREGVAVIAALLMLAAAVLTAPGALRARARMSPHRLPASFERDDIEKGLLGMAFSLDMFGVCLRSGMPVATAALVVAAAAPVELARILRRAGRCLRWVHRHRRHGWTRAHPMIRDTNSARR